MPRQNLQGEKISSTYLYIIYNISSFVKHLLVFYVKYLKKTKIQTDNDKILVFLYKFIFLFFCIIH
jgi:hypothetical protein